MSEQHRAEERQVRDLIAAAGPRVEPPADRVAAIKEAARGEWREMVQRERRHGRARRLAGGLALAAGVIAAVAVGWWWVSRAPLTAPVVAELELVTGAVRAGAQADPAAGAEVTAGALVETGDAPAGVALRLVGGQSLRLAAGSRARLASERRLELERGALYVDSGSGSGGVEVVTALGTVRDIGTQFEVRLEPGATILRLRVREGECSLEAGGESHKAVRGEQLERTAGAGVSRAAIALYGPAWDWVLATAPKLRVDGRSLFDVLGRLQRELGREIRYADADLEAHARGAILSGPAEGLAPTVILETTLLANGLYHRLENGGILITR